MSNSDFDNEMDRYFNDPEYRRQKASKDNSGHSGYKNWFSFNWNKNDFVKWTTIAGGITVILFTGFLIFLFSGLPSVSELENPQTAIASEVKSRDGVVLDRFYTENRTYVPYEDISPHAINALIATEDHRFYEHWGIDMIRTLSVPWHLLNGRIQGGSTITQQLARNLYKKIGREFSIIRKLREMITAIEIEGNYTKREIIEMYLNTVEFPNSAFGIQSAAYTHYGKTAKELTAPEAATLIGSLKGVYLYNPRINPENAISRRNTVLMLLNERGFLDNTAYNQLLEQPLQLDYHPPSKAGTESRYFGQYVRQQIEGWAEENGYNLNTDGLTIYTTIDSRYQKYAQQAVETKLDSLQSIFVDEWTSSNGEFMDIFWQRYPQFLPSFIRETDRFKNGFSKYDTDQSSVVMEKLRADEAFVDSVKRAKMRLEAGFVGIDPKTGEILCWIGGSDYGDVQFDHVYQSERQAGSTFKPFVYTVAIDNGYMPYHRFSKYPRKFVQKSGRVWAPKDPSVPEGPDMLPLRQGLARSLNNVTVGLLPEIAGAPNTNRVEDLMPAAQKIKQMAENMGIDLSDERVFPSIALGTAEVSLLELTSAYTTFANQGVHIEPFAITRIEDKSGNVIKEYQPEFQQEAISPETAYIMIDMMRGVIRGGEDYYGTGVRLQSTYNIRQDIAGKTGTTQNAADNWFMGMTPHIVMGAWVGGADRRIRFPETSRTGQGAHTALPMVGRFMNLASSDPDAPWSYEAFEPPAGFVMPREGAGNNGNNTGTGRIDW
ncbi:transglycosylase domain-containing protein [Aliifodinibius salicampi]|uniref:Transglycosylase domain-containing protein n=1 Tax=Fodinibius salicampi TaxID=1920655 RepID=A0ABT3PV06_9BACT|nr:transglycosylase domain-containing protein [Fodinibius salicampi]MCW9711687.1 transglycosylase domain-containing protein [Fodinibius salicampi]